MIGTFWAPFVWITFFHQIGVSLGFNISKHGSYQLHKEVRNFLQQHTYKTIDKSLSSLSMITFFVVFVAFYLSCIYLTITLQIVFLLVLGEELYRHNVMQSKFLPIIVRFRFLWSLFGSRPRVTSILSKYTREVCCTL